MTSFSLGAPLSNQECRGISVTRTRSTGTDQVSVQACFHVVKNISVLNFPLTAVLVASLSWVLHLPALHSERQNHFKTMGLLISLQHISREHDVSKPTKCCRSTTTFATFEFCKTHSHPHQTCETLHPKYQVEQINNIKSLITHCLFKYHRVEGAKQITWGLNNCWYRTHCFIHHLLQSGFARSNMHQLNLSNLSPHVYVSTLPRLVNIWRTDSDIYFHVQADDNFW